MKCLGSTSRIRQVITDLDYLLPIYCLRGTRKVRKGVCLQNIGLRPWPPVLGLRPLSIRDVEVLRLHPNFDQLNVAQGADSDGLIHGLLMA